MTDRVEGYDAPRVLGCVEGPEPGPILIVVGGLHGNEPSGVQALQRLIPKLAADPRGLEHGRFIGLTGNRQALRRRQRYISHDLNRHWLPERVERLKATSAPLSDEDAELKELNQEIERQLESATHNVYLLDLHTTSGPELPFATLEDDLANRPFAFAFPVPVVLGLEEELAGTLNTYVASRGIITAGFESGQHGTDSAVDRAEAAIWIALETSGVLQPGSRPEAAAARKQLADDNGKLPHVVEVRYRHAIRPEDQYRMDPGYNNFHSVTKGLRVGQDRRGPVETPISGLMLMPLYQAQGADGFFIVKPVYPIWLALSAMVRRWRLERILHFLPGVQRHPELAGSFVVDRRYARWLSLELFHLLGFVCHDKGSRIQVMTRRDH
ncbi:MAG: succinylglutamate desuccinylase/aspartoacylase family protein [Acidobacteriota bacterium]